ncbi:MAG TPA: hypothetical protein PLT47_03785 [Bacteroidales bacterium]|nr:hypothetical protein [Bacteroidales bacterium]HQI69843.1 hypothetical protein [Bacteroidales bacterium]
MELSKKDKKAARILIEQGLHIEYALGLSQFDSILQQWKNKELNNHDAYMQLYDSVIKYDKHIARRYNDLGGSRYLMTVVALLRDGIIAENDLRIFSDEARNNILFCAGYD